LPILPVPSFYDEGGKKSRWKCDYYYKVLVTFPLVLKTSVKIAHLHIAHFSRTVHDLKRSIHKTIGSKNAGKTVSVLCARSLIDILSGTKAFQYLSKGYLIKASFVMGMTNCGGLIRFKLPVRCESLKYRTCHAITILQDEVTVFPLCSMLYLSCPSAFGEIKEKLGGKVSRWNFGGIPCGTLSKHGLLFNGKNTSSDMSELFYGTLTTRENIALLVKCDLFSYNS